MWSGPTVDTLEDIVFSGHVATSGAVHVVGTGTVYRATKDNYMDSVPSYYSNKYPCSRIMTVYIVVKRQTFKKIVRLLIFHLTIYGPLINEVVSWSARQAHLYTSAN
jgi:hypothetical protein